MTCQHARSATLARKSTRNAKKETDERAYSCQYCNVDFMGNLNEVSTKI